MNTVVSTFIDDLLNSTTKQQAWDAIVPDSIETDYIELADQSGFTIPDNSIGRKGAIPYFGDKPITDGVTVNVFNKNISVNVGTGFWKTNPIFVSPVPASFFSPAANRVFIIDIDLMIEYTGTANAFDWVIGIVLEQDEADFLFSPGSAGIIFIEACNSNAKPIIVSRQSLFFSTQPLSPGLATINPIGTTPLGTITASDSGGVTVTQSILIGNHAIVGSNFATDNQADNLKVFMVPINPTPGNIASVVGKIKLTLPAEIYP